MKIAIISILAIALIGGGYVFIKDQRIKAELSNVEESKEVESNATSTATVADSVVTLNRVNGVWSVTSTGEFTVDPTSLAFEFTGYKPGGQHVGTFNNMSATISLDEMGNPVASQITIDPKSVQTDSDGVTTHLQKKEFFDTEAFADIKINIKEIQSDATNLKAITDLTIKGVTKTLAIPVKVAKLENGMVFAVDTRIKISEFGMAYGPVQDEVRVTLGGELYKK